MSTNTHALKARISVQTVLPFVAFLIAYTLLPRYVQDKHITMLIYVGINVLLALGLNLLMGYAGQISLGHAAFFGMGAYTSAILTLSPTPMVPEVIPAISIGIGIMTGSVTLISLTRATGFKLASSIAGLLLLSWVWGRMHFGLPVAFVVFGAGMSAIGFGLRIGWWKTGLAGVACVTLCKLSLGFLTSVIATSVSPWTAMGVGVFVTGLVAYLIGGQILRLKGHYLAMATLGFGIIIEIVLKQWSALVGQSSDGLFGIPEISILDALPKPLQHLLRVFVGHEVDPSRAYYYLVWGFVFVALVLAVNIVRSRIGRAFRAVHGSEVAASSLGVDTERYKVQVFVLSAAMASVAGSLYAHNVGVGYINASEFNFMVSVQLVVMVVIGGMASIWGALLGAFTIEFLKGWLMNLEKADLKVMGFALKGLDPIVFGAVLILVMIVLPQGLVRGLTDAASNAWRAARRAKKGKAA